MLYASNSPVPSKDLYANSSLSLAAAVPSSGSDSSPFLSYCTVCDVQLDPTSHLYCSDACKDKDSTSAKDLPSLALLCGGGDAEDTGEDMHDDEGMLSPGRFNTSIFDFDDSIVGLGFRSGVSSTAANGGDSGLPPSPTDISRRTSATSLLSARGKLSPLACPIPDEDSFDEPGSSRLNRHSTAFSDLVGPRANSFALQSTTASSAAAIATNPSRKRISAPAYHQASPLLSSSTTRGRRQSFYVRPGGNSSSTYFDTTLTTTPTMTSAASTITTATTTSSRTSDRSSIYAADTIDVPLKRTSSTSIYPDSPRSISLVMPSTTPIQHAPAELEYEFPRVTKPTPRVCEARAQNVVDLVDSVNNHHAAFF